ncbi:MAG: hypothetical protein EA376_01090 [Phycisphaeraceae bacterium]|nr:MAG: hypothetical protein EA376_01090 [Phycisphaeraceae bacterium]
MGDHILLERGGVWNESLPRLNKSGRSLQYPLVIGAFGDGPRPIIIDNFPIRTANSGNPLNHIAIVGLHLRAPDDWDGQGGDAVGVWVQRTGENLLIEDCLIEGFANNIAVQGMAIGGRKDLRLRRTILANPRRFDSGCTNIYIESTDGITIDQSAFINVMANELNGSKVSHNVYIHESCGIDDVTVTDSIFYNARTNLTMRTGGRAEGNLLIRGGQGIAVAVSRTDEQNAPAIVRGNVITHSRNHWDGQQLGIGIDLGRSSASLIDDNIIFHGTDGGYHNGIIIQSSANDTLVSNNIIYGWGAKNEADWNPAFRIGGYTGHLKVVNNTFIHTQSQWITMASVSLSNVIFQGNRYHTPRGMQAILDADAGWQIPVWRAHREPDAIWVYIPPATWPTSLNTILGENVETWLNRVHNRSPGTWPADMTAPHAIEQVRTAFN